jgi:hypothetical protein
MESIGNGGQPNHTFQQLLHQSIALAHASTGNVVQVRELVADGHHYAAVVTKYGDVTGGNTPCLGPKTQAPDQGHTNALLEGTSLCPSPLPPSQTP